MNTQEQAFYDYLVQLNNATQEAVDCARRKRPYPH